MMAADGPLRTSLHRSERRRCAWDPKSPMREIDLFVETPIAFQDLWGRSKIADVEGSPVRIAGIRDLITLKRLAGRPQDLQDIEALEAIEKETGSRG